MFKKTQTATPLDEEIARLHAEMCMHQPETPKYAAIADQIVKLYAIKDPKSKTGVSPDVLATIAANLIGIGMIIHHERAGVIASKAIGFVSKLR